MSKASPLISDSIPAIWPFNPWKTYQSPYHIVEIELLELSETESKADSQSALVNMSLLATIAVWAMPKDAVANLFNDALPSELKKLRTQMNRDVVRVVMLVLAHRAFATGQAQTFSLRQLAKAIDEPRIESMQRTLRNWVLPMLSQAGLIDGFVLTTTWSTEPHEIAITDKGLDFLKTYFTELAQASPLFQTVQ